MLYHITSQPQWQQAQKLGDYRPPSLQSEGFIHCSTRQQVLSTANRFFQHQTGLVLLGIDPNLVEATIRDDAADDDFFPHIYGPLNIGAVLYVWELIPDACGTFTTLPKIR
ncbi:MAG TPA: DUF952 domain-containing protein [Coleofasciculaceae cyanobacterium]